MRLLLLTLSLVRLLNKVSSRKARARTISTDLGRKDHDPRSRADPEKTRRGRAPAGVQVAAVGIGPRARRGGKQNKTPKST